MSHTICVTLGRLCKPYKAQLLHLLLTDPNAVPRRVTGLSSVMLVKCLALKLMQDECSVNIPHEFVFNAGYGIKLQCLDLDHKIF